jgi:hypothetical protein
MSASVESEIRGFKGAANAGLRKALREACASEYPIRALEALGHSVGLTGVGRAKLDAVIVALKASKAVAS